MRNQRLWRGAAVLLLAVLATTVIVGCQGKANQLKVPPPPQVTVAQPLVKPITDYFFATGHTKSIQEATLRARVAGYLKKITFKDGDIVQEGELLFVIDKAPYEAALDAAEAQLAKSQAQLELAKAELARQEELARRGAGTQNALDVAQANQATAAASVAAAKASIEQARLDLGYTEIRAPFTGKMSKNEIDIGNLVQVGTTILGSIESVGPIYAEFYLSETEFLELRHGQSAVGVPMDDSQPPTIELAIGEEGDFVFDEGELDFSAFGVDPATGTNFTRAVFPNAENHLVPGLFVRVRAPIGKPKESLLIENRAIMTDQRGDYVLVIDEDNKVVYTPVVLGRIDYGLRVIESGLKPEDRVIIRGLQSARPQQKVTPLEGKMTRLDTGEPTAFVIGDRATAIAKTAPIPQKPTPESQESAAPPQEPTSPPEPEPTPVSNNSNPFASNSSPASGNSSRIRTIGHWSDDTEQTATEQTAAKLTDDVPPTRE